MTLALFRRVLLSAGFSAAFAVSALAYQAVRGLSVLDFAITATILRASEVS